MSDRNDMSNNGRLTVLCTGSDKRQLYAAGRLSRVYGAEVILCMTDGVIEGARCAASPDELDREADVLLLPTPCGTGLSIPAADDLTCGMLVGALKKGALVIGGKMPTAMIEFFHSRGFDTADLLRREELAIKNAVPTAEGTLGIIMTESAETVSGMDIAVTGWGHVAKACAKLLSAAGARVEIFARSITALAEAESCGLRACHISQLTGKAGGFLTIVNTVPALVITEEVIRSARPGCLIIDLASKPGGTDFAACRSMQRRAIHALSLPGKCSPVTAGEITADTVMNICKERSSKYVT